LFNGLLKREKSMSLFNSESGMIHVDYVPSTMESIEKNYIKQDKVGIEAVYIDNSPCKNCEFKLTCLDECDEFEKYVDPLKFQRKINKANKKAGKL